MSPANDEFADDEAAFFFEGDEQLAAVKKAARCRDPVLREVALAHLAEENVWVGAKLAEEILAAADAGDVELTDAQRGACIEAIELAIDRPDWYEPGARIVLPERDEP